MTSLTEEAEACRHALYGGTVDATTLASATGRSKRTIARYVAAGLPVIRIGRELRFDVTKVRAWMLSHESRHDTPKRGRPAARRAA